MTVTAVRSVGKTPPAGTPAPTFKVETVSGDILTVLVQSEVDWYTGTRDAYLEETKFSLASDLRDLDRLLGMELMVYRWTTWLAAGVDYDGVATEYAKIDKQVSSYGTEVAKLKGTLGLSKAARDAAANEGTVGAYITQLKQRAKAFGVHRERQTTKAIALLQEMFALVATFDRSDEEERRKLGIEKPEDILDWVRKTARPEFEQLDEAFRNAGSDAQRYWVRHLAGTG